MTAYFGARHWKPAVLKDLVFLQRGFDITKAQQKEGNIPVISSSGPSSWHNQPMAEGPGVVIGRKGTLGSVYYTEENYWPHDTTLWSKSLNENNPRFVYYALKCLGLERFNVGGANPTLNRNHIHNLPIRLADRSTQNDIVSILSAYDDLIGNNQRRIELLQEAARMLYCEWFVHFHFPGHTHVKMIDGLPEGWKRQALGSMATILKGKNITKEKAISGVVPVVAGGLQPAYFHNEANALAPVITVSASGANAGYVSVYLQDIWASDCSYLSASENKNWLFIYQLMKARQKEITAMQKGAAQPHVYPKDLKRLQAVNPSPKFIRFYEEVVSASFFMIFNLNKQNTALSQARDLLLPRLMNGEIAV